MTTCVDAGMAEMADHPVPMQEKARKIRREARVRQLLSTEGVRSVSCHPNQSGFPFWPLLA